MPSFPERESSILAVLKKKKPGRVPENEIRPALAHNIPQTDHTTNHTTNSHVSKVLHLIYLQFILCRIM